MGRAAAALLEFLGQDGARVEGSGAAALVLVRGDGRRMAVDGAALAALAERGLIARQGTRILAAGTSGDGAAVAAPPDRAESPLALLWRRRTKAGEPFLTEREFSAGERLRADYTRGQIMPRLGANWVSSVSSGKRSFGGGAVELTDAALGARRRVDAALAAVGPELAGVLVDVCCFLKGLEQVEFERQWPVRSAKIVLKTALGALSRHYDPKKSAKPRAFHWGSDDYRPSIDPED